jgi:hypothetical protein
MKISWIYWVALALFTVLLGSMDRCSSLLKDRERLQDNIEVLTGDVEHYRVNDSLNAAGINRLYMTKGELERYNSELVQQIKYLDVKLKRVQSASRTAMETMYEIKTTVSDSIVYRYADTTANSTNMSTKGFAEVSFDTLQCINYKDGWLTFEGCWDKRGYSNSGGEDLNKGNYYSNYDANFRISSRDTLIQVVHRVPKRFLFFRFGTKAIRQEILSRNPHTNIIYTEYVELK